MKPETVTWRVRARICECDAPDHVNSAVYLTCLQQATVEAHTIGHVRNLEARGRVSI